MKTSQSQVYLVAALLIVTGLGLALYKFAVLGFPLVPGQKQTVWTLEAKISFTPVRGPVTATLNLPRVEAGWQIFDENFASSGFGFTIRERLDGRRAEWTRRELNVPASLYYKLQVTRPVASKLAPYPHVIPLPPRLDPDRQLVVEQLAELFRQKSSDDRSFAELLIREFYKKQPVQEATYLIGRDKSQRLDVIIDVLANAAIPAHKVRGIFLEDGRRRQKISDLLEVYTGEGWVVFDPASGNQGLPDNFFIWSRGDSSLFDVIGGRNSKIEFALLKHRLPTRAVRLMDRKDQVIPLLDFSIYSLPVEQQGVFKSLLLIPIGALVVVLMRVLVGVNTSGTFMPILIALAFIQTDLLPGLIIFLIVVSAGLWIRYYLSYLNLLLVARMSAVIILVITLMASISIFSYKLGVDRALAVTFFPTIILSWTIERMSILWEENGPHEVLIQGGGSLLVAVVAFLFMTNRYVEYLTFNFPELILSLFGVILLLGQYRGYRLSELHRFRYLKDE